MCVAIVTMLIANIPTNLELLGRGQCAGSARVAEMGNPHRRPVLAKALILKGVGTLGWFIL